TESAKLADEAPRVARTSGTGAWASGFSGSTAWSSSRIRDTRPTPGEWVTQPRVQMTPLQKEITMVSQERLAHLAQFTDEHLAYHEAGHAVIHHLHGGTVLRLSIERTDPREGMHPAKQPTPAESSDQMKALRDLVALLV